MAGERWRVREGIDGLHIEPGQGPPLAWEAKSRSTSVRHWWPWRLRGKPADLGSSSSGSSAIGFVLPWILLAAVSWFVPGFFWLLVGLLTLVALALLAFLLLVQFPLRWLSRRWEPPVVASESTNGTVPPRSG